MNYKKLSWSAIALIIVVFISNFLIHQVWLKSTYMETPNLWRTMDEMQNFMSFMMAGQTIFGIVMMIIFAHGYKGTGVGEGIRFGLIFGALTMANEFIMYAVAPYPSKLMWSWVAAGFAQAIACGVIASMIYKPRTA